VTIVEEIDYATSGLDIQYAMLDHFKRYQNKTLHSEYILWDGIKVKTGDWWVVPDRGRIKIELIEWQSGIEQAVDVKIEDGCLTLVDGTEVSLLRTWTDSRYDNIVEYPYFTRAGRLFVCNVFKRLWPSGRVTEENWTGNAGFWVDEISPLDRIYHCSHGAAPTPDFSLFIFRVTVFAA
jgi:hypothetical protein